MAFSIMMIAPMVAIFAVGQRYFIQGITFTGLKG
jgi:ABC-type glycerol-3-phosphate transport system permease component